ncbi:MAG: GreA/GreB family elongation factor [candidate division WOR-3 bacterium]
MDSLIQSFRLHLGRNEYDELDDIWLELTESEADPQELLDLAELAERYAPPGKAEDFLWILADALKERGQWDSQFDALKRLVRLSSNETRLSAELAANLRHRYAGVAELERLLQKSGLSYGRPLKQALDTMERYIHLLPGSWLFHPDWGACQVKQLDLLLDRVTVRCAGLTEYTLNLDSAHRRLRPAAYNGYFRRLAEDRPGLAKLAAENPTEVVLLYLRDTGLPAGVAELKAGLSELVAEPAWDSFWNRARKGLDSHPHVQVRTRPSRTYQWSEERVLRTDEVSVRDANLRTQSEDMNAARVEGMSEEEVVKTYEALSTSTKRRRLLETVRKARPELVPKLFVLGKDNKLRSWLAEELSTQESALNSLLNSVLNGYRNHPDALIWLAGNAWGRRPETAPAVLSRLTDLLESRAYRKNWPRLAAALAADRYELLRLGLGSMDDSTARSLYTRLSRLISLAPFQQDEIRTLFAERFPDLAQTEEALLSTAAGIERARAELARLTNEEIPRSAEEIGRARAHGDLSENYEYKAAKEKQARLLQQVAKLRQDLARARPIVPAEVDCSTVSVGCRVKLEDQTGATHDYAILGPWDSDPDRGVISYLAPLGQKLLSRKPGETIELDGRFFTIKEVNVASAYL